MFGRLSKNYEVILTYNEEFLGDMTDKEIVQSEGDRFLEVPYIIKSICKAPAVIMIDGRGFMHLFLDIGCVIIYMKMI